MAEFQEVMRQYIRMCNKREGCGGCPFEYVVHSTCVVCSDDLAKVESVVMAWAAKHPEPRYPTWREAINSVFPKLVNMPVEKCPCCLFGDDNYAKHCDGKCATCWDEPIPAIVAEELGVEMIRVEVADG